MRSEKVRFFFVDFHVFFGFKVVFSMVLMLVARCFCYFNRF